MRQSQFTMHRLAPRNFFFAGLGMIHMSTKCHTRRSNVVGASLLNLSRGRYNRKAILKIHIFRSEFWSNTNSKRICKQQQLFYSWWYIQVRCNITMMPSDEKVSTLFNKYHNQSWSLNLIQRCMPEWQPLPVLWWNIGIHIAATATPSDDHLKALQFNIPCL